jgi:aminomethyltransferase
MSDSASPAGRKTPLYDEHVAAGAKIVDFVGWAMPMYYRGIVSEHKLVRETVGLFDVSHMGEFVLTGSDALATLDRIVTNRVGALTEGRVQLTLACNEEGGVLDDLLVYRLPGRYMLVVNAANREKDLAWIREHVRGDARVEDVSDETALVAVQGPSSERVLGGVADADVAALPYYHSADLTVAGRRALVSRTGYTGEDGFEVYCAPDDAATVWGGLLEAGASEGIEPVGLGARDTLRLEMGYALYGNEMDESRTPVETGLLWVTKLDKGDFIGRDAIAARQDAGARERLVGFELLERGIPRKDQAITVGGEAVGLVTSGSYSPSLDRGIGLGYVPSGVEDAVEVSVRARSVPARIVGLPFYRGGSVRRRRAGAPARSTAR